MRILIAANGWKKEPIVKKELISAGWEVVTCRTGDEAYKILTSEDPPCIALLEDTLEGVDICAICRRIRDKAKRISRYIYIIAVKSSRDRGEVVEILRAGADDYLDDVPLEEILSRISVGMRLCSYVQDLKSENDKLKMISRWEPLTGAYTRAATMEQLNLAMYRAKREKNPLSVILLDVVHMHGLNERYGNSVGDKILQEIAREVVARIRKTDTLGRLGKDDFLVILPGVNEKVGRAIKKRLKQSVKEIKIPELDASCSISLKSALLTWDGSASPEEVLSTVYKSLE